MSDRGQSETLGFVLVFAIMVSSVGLVYTTGFAGLTDIRDVERVNNAERAYQVFADNMEDMTQRNAPSRATEIKVADASMYVGEPIEIEVNIIDEFNTTYDLRPVVFDANTGTQLLYVQGAVIRQQGETGIVAHESTLLFNDSRTVIPIVQTRRGDGTSSVGGVSTVLIRADLAETTVDYSNTSGPYEVWFNVTSPRASTWQAYLEAENDIDTCLLSGDTVSCKTTADQVHLVSVKIDIEFE